MAYNKYATNNLAQGTFSAGISAGATTLVLNGQGGLFPSTFPFICKLEQFTGTNVVKREIVKVTNRIGDTLTIVRSFEQCPSDYTATSQTNTAFAFNAGDVVSLVETKETIVDIQDELTRLETDKLNKNAQLRTGNGTWKVSHTDGSGNEVELSLGANGTVLTSNGPASAPIFQIPTVAHFPFGDGSDGALVISSGTTNLNLNQVYNYSSISISVGATLSTAGTNGEMRLKCNGMTTISGTILLSGKNATQLAMTSIFGNFASNPISAGGKGGNGGAGGTSAATIGGTGGNGSSLGYGGGGGGGGASTDGVTKSQGGNGGVGGTPIGTGGTAGTSGVNAGAGGTSAGGGGGGSSASGGVGGGTAYSTNGGNGGGAGAGAGGGAGANINILAGANLKLHTFNISGAGSIISVGQAGLAGGAGGTTSGTNSGGWGAGGSGGGGGGGGQCGGHISVVASAGTIFGGTITNTGGAGGAGGAVGNTGASAVAGQAGTAGTAGITGGVVNSLLKNLIF